MVYGKEEMTNYEEKTIKNNTDMEKLQVSQSGMFRVAGEHKVCRHVVMRHRET